MTSVEDEVALARRLLGLEVEEAPQAAAPTAVPISPVAPTHEPLAAETPRPSEEKPADWFAALAAASSVAVADDVAQHTAETSTQAEAEITPAVEAPVAERITPQEIATAEATFADLPATETDAETISPPAEPEPIPEWVSELAPPEIAADAVLGAPVELEQGELPEWVYDLKKEEGVATASALLAHLPELDDQERGELPDWLREPLPPEPAAPAPAAAQVEAPEPVRTVAGLELPAWFTADALAPEPRGPFEVVETMGTLGGVSGILPLALAITEPHTLTTPTPARSDGGRVFQSILAEPLAAAGAPVADAAARPLFTANHILYLLILLAALVPLFIPFNQAGLGLDVTNAPSALFYEQLQAIPPDGAVLLAFDYTPGQGVELDPAARAIVHDLVTRKANVIAVSSNPNGAALAETILSRAREASPQFNFVNVGYIAGGEAGLRALASGWLPANRPDVNGALWGAQPLARTITSMDNLALTVIIAGDDASLRMWMEQVQPRVHSPIVAATTAAVEPQARNYVNARQLQASLRGLAGAAELELEGNYSGQAVKTIDAVSIVSVVLAGIIVLANVMGLFGLATRKK